MKNFSRDNFLLSKNGSRLRHLSDQFFESCGFSPEAFCETNNIVTIRNMVSTNTGVAFIAESCAVDRDKIQYYPLSPALFRLNLLYIRKNWTMNELETAFFSHLTEYFNHHTESPYLAENYMVHIP